MRTNLPGKKPDRMSVNLLSFLLLLWAVGLGLWSLYLIDDVFMPGNAILLTILTGAILGSILFLFVWKKDRFPVVIIIIYGIFVGCPASLFAVIGGNHYFRSDERFDITTDILDTGNNISKSGNCQSVFALAVYDKIGHEVEFPCSYRGTIEKYKRVRLQLSKGLFGYYILLDQELIN